ncbi:MAG: single-stranded DNA-binding protein [Candidatus Aminicenantes bacterium]|jgi:single-strand DNA-binding protein|nr:single-stranded DNA-binding protein [Candidatus Aminicenantes bacterium]MQY60967.1 single-stranded DNA-binding protein [bacterium]TET73595.1 MAG: single-stranded DNA-binding protein [Candidatus Aminicenantes bacterium]
MRDKNSLNKVMLIGHLGKKPELRYLPQGERAVAKFSLATNERYFNPSTNESNDRTEWHKIVTWGKLAEFCEKYLDQGKQIYLEGKLRTRNWQDKDGNQRYTTEIEAENITFLGKREEQVEDQDHAEPKPKPPSDLPEDAAEAPDKEKEDEDEVPF